MFGVVTPSRIERDHDECEIDGLLARRDLDLRAKHAERPGKDLHRFYPLCLRRCIRFARTPAQDALDVGTIGVKVISEKVPHSACASSSHSSKGSSRVGATSLTF